MKLISLLFCSLLFTGCAAIRDQVQAPQGKIVIKHSGIEEKLQQKIQEVKKYWGVRQVGVGYPNKWSPDEMSAEVTAEYRAKVDYMEKVLHKDSAVLVGIGVDYVLDDHYKVYAAIAFDIKKKLFGKRKSPHS